MKNSFLEEALRYEEMGLSVIPILPGQKKPLIKWQSYQTQRATNKQIREWWAETPNANVGIVTGRISNLFVIDLDRYAPEYDENMVVKYIPDNLICPVVLTPRNGQHLYFSMPDEDISIGARFLPGCDFRGEGGYVLAPPSVNGTGKAYTWSVDLVDAKLEAPPVAIIKKISTIYRGVTENVTGIKQSVTPVTICDIWQNGKRDENLYHVAQCLANTGNEDWYIKQVLTAIMTSWGEHDEKWINTKVESAFHRLERRAINIAQEVENFVSVTTGYFSVTDCYSLLHSVTAKDKAAIRQALNRLKERGVIEKYGLKDGVYKFVEKDIESIIFDVDDEEEKEYPIRLPLGLNDLIEVAEGNIILIAGEFNSGKTTMMLNILKDNKNTVPIRYISSEMGKGEFKKRFKGFGLPMDFWYQDKMTEYIQRSSDFHMVLQKDALNIIDYLEFPGGDYTQGAEIMRKIYDNLGKGVAVVAVQKKEGQRMPRAGDMLLEKPRLAITLTKESNERAIGIAEIIKAKLVKLGKADGKKLRYEILNLGSRIKTITDWGWWR